MILLLTAQVVLWDSLNRLPHAAHTTIPWITFCHTIMRFNQSKKFDIFISNIADCVIRAISTATGDTWEHVYMDMVKHSIKECTVFNDKKFIKKYITKVLGLKNAETTKIHER